MNGEVHDRVDGIERLCGAHPFAGRLGETFSQRLRENGWSERDREQPLPNPREIAGLLGVEAREVRVEHALRLGRTVDVARRAGFEEVAVRLDERVELTVYQLQEIA